MHIALKVGGILDTDVCSRSKGKSRGGGHFPLGGTGKATVAKQGPGGRGTESRLQGDGKSDGEEGAEGVL